MKDKLKKSSELKNSFLILILGCILSTLAVLNSNFVNSHKNQIMLNNEKKQFFDRIISKRYLQEDSDEREIKSKNDTDKVCEKGSQELRDYYKTGDFSKIGIKDDPITCKEKDKEYMKALKKIVKKYIGGGKGKRNLQENTNESNKDDDITESFINYGKHIIPLIIFLVIGILCIPGWLICCFCCCCNCCCCCCCKKSGCKIPCFIFTYVFYALAVAVSIYGLSQSNQIFEGMANTECSFLRFVDELLDGETKETKPKWAGIEGITSILNNIKGILVDLKGEKIGNINTHIENLLDDGSTTTPRNIFLNKIKIAEQSFIDPATSEYIDKYYKSYDLNGKYPGAKYLLDLISFFGKYETAKDEEAPGKTILGGWIYEYSEISKVADETLGGTKDDFNDVMVENVDDIIKILDDGQKVVKDLKSNFQGIQDGAAQSIIDYSDTIDNYGKLGCKLLFSVIGLINIALAIFVLFICLFSGKMCTNCCCCRCLFKFLTHLLWNILALLMIITFIVGFSLSFTGQVGSDAMSLISYIVSEDNIGDGKENLIVDQLEEARDYLYTCINGDGDIMKKLNMSEESMGSFDELKKAETELDKYIEQFDTIKENKQAYKYAEELLTDRTEDLETENDFGLICQNYDDFQSESDLSKYPSPYLKFKETLSNINDDVFIKAKNEKYDNTCTKEGSCSVDSTCYHPLTCLPHDRAWFGTGEGLQQDLKDNIQIVKDIKEAIKFAGDETKEGSYKSVITDLGAKYDDYLDSYKGVLEEVKGVIKELTDIIIKYTGEEGGLFSFVNCNFVGKNVKIILKYLRDALGKNVYTVGVCLFIVGCSLALSISATILLIIVINISIDENKRDQNKNPEFQFGSSGRVIQYQ